MKTIKNPKLLFYISAHKVIMQITQFFIFAMGDESLILKTWTASSEESGRNYSKWGWWQDKPLPQKPGNGDNGYEFLH